MKVKSRVVVADLARELAMGLLLSILYGCYSNGLLLPIACASYLWVVSVDLKRLLAMGSRYRSHLGASNLWLLPISYLVGACDGL